MFMRKVVKKNTLQDETHIVRLHGIYDVHIVDAKSIATSKKRGFLKTARQLERGS